ncbi:hypothetical protein [Variovorax sp. UC122_21]|uniref:hypothetical protein n=1 Tax=Variovorax sp. UC122_21 TaxID=3374554 RepID=UPI003756735A
MFAQGPTVDAAMVQGVAAHINTRANPTYALIFSTTQPSTPGTPVSDTPLVTALFGPASVTAGVLALAQVDASGDQILVSGDATWIRLFDGDGAWLGDGDVTDETGAGFAKVLGTDGTRLRAGARAKITISLA